MAAVYTIIVFLVGIVPLLVLDSGAFFQALILAVTAIAIVLVAVNIRAGDLARLAGLLGPSAAVAALPGVWMVLQLLAVARTGSSDLDQRGRCPEQTNGRDGQY